jgi:hypothetical protein
MRTSLERNEMRTKRNDFFSQWQSSNVAAFRCPFLTAMKAVGFLESNAFSPLPRRV